MDPRWLTLKARNLKEIGKQAQSELANWLTLSRRVGYTWVVEGGELVAFAI